VPNGLADPAAADQNSRALPLKAARQLLNERNSIEMSLSKLAAHSNLSSALVKYDFGNKEGLMLALLQSKLSIKVSSRDGFERSIPCSFLSAY
jgi:AcrR family transcriptional regulator